MENLHRKDFPIFDRLVNGKKLVYFDNAATTLKPKCVVDRISEYYLYESSNIHRGLHFLSDLGTQNYEKARRGVRDFLNARSEEEIVFNKGTTDGINFIAQTYGWQFLNDGDEILISEYEHHSNIVPWQILAKRKNLKIKTFEPAFAPSQTIENFRNTISKKTKLVSLLHISNTLGYVMPVQEICRIAHEQGAVVVVDGAQSVAHMNINVQEMDCDFFVFSSHKIYGPTGLGVLYGKKELLSKLEPATGGGGMIDQVTVNETTYIDAPFRFESGTPHVEGVLGLHAALKYVQSIGIESISRHENSLTQLLYSKLVSVPGIDIYGGDEHRSAIVSFNIQGIHPSDIGSLLDQYGIAVRTGHHCTQPLMKKYNIPGTVRVSFAIYNTADEIDFFMESLLKVLKLLKA